VTKILGDDSLIHKKTKYPEINRGSPRGCNSVKNTGEQWWLVAIGKSGRDVIGGDYGFCFQRDFFSDQYFFLFFPLFLCLFLVYVYVSKVFLE
jgi:hypothetical protein